MADNYVEIRIKADDTAKPDLTELKADLDELGRKVDTAKVDVDDDDAKLKLLDINAKLAALDRRVVNPKITTASAARAESDIAKLNSDMDKLDQKAKENSSKGGLLGKLLFGDSGGESGSSGSSGGGGLLGSFGSLPSMGGGLGELLSNPYSLGAIGAAAQAALVELTGLVSGFAAAGAGAGAFALLAAPAFEAVKGAIGDTHAQMMKLPVDERDAVASIQGIEYEFGKLSKAFEPQVFKIFNDGLGIAYHLLPTITPFANAFANALDGLLKQVGKFTGSTGFKDWLAQFQKLTGPSTSAIGDGIGKVAVAIGKLMTIMSKKDVVNAINIAFTILAGTITGIGLAVKFAMFQWDMLTKEVDSGRTAAVAAARAIASGFDEVRHAAADLAHNVAAYFDQIRASIVRAVTSAISFVRSNWKLIVALIAGPLGLAVDVATTHLRGLETAFRVSWDAISAIVRAAVGVVTAILRPFAAWLEPLFKGAWNAVVAVFRWAFGLLRSTTSSGVSSMNSAVSSGIDRLIGFVRTIPGRINSALSGLPGMMFQAGVHLISGLINGIGSMLGSAMSAAAHVGKSVLGAFEAATGIGSPSRITFQHGRWLAEGLINGMDSMHSPVNAAATRLAGGAVPARYGTGGGAAGGGAITLNITGSDSSVVKALVLALRREIRVQGGDVQAVLGH